MGAQVAKRIAVINDDQDFIAMTTLLLEDEGYEVRACHRGELALPLLRQWRPQLVLLDLRMAGLSGWDTLSLIESEPSLAGTRVLISSGAAEEARAQRDRLRTGGHDLIELPFDLDQFRRVVRQMAGDPLPTAGESLGVRSGRIFRAAIDD